VGYFFDQSCIIPRPKEFGLEEAEAEEGKGLSESHTYAVRVISDADVGDCGVSLGRL